MHFYGFVSRGGRILKLMLYFFSGYGQLSFSEISCTNWLNFISSVQKRKEEPSSLFFFIAKRCATNPQHVGFGAIVTIVSICALPRGYIHPRFATVKMMMCRCIESCCREAAHCIMMVPTRSAKKHKGCSESM